MSSPLSAEDRDKILALSHQAAADFQDGRRAAWAAVYAEDGQLMPPNATTVKGKEAIQAFGESFPDMQELTFHDFELSGEGDTAISVSAISMRMVGEDGATITDTAKQLVVLRRQADGEWAVTHAMFNSDLPI